MMHTTRVAAVLALLVLGGCASAPRQTVVPVDVPVPPPDTPVPVLLEELRSPKASTRAAAAWQLTGVKEDQAHVALALIPLRSDPSQSVRYAAMWALGHLEANPQGAAPPVEDETPPRLVCQTRPRYPEAAFKAKTQGTVLLEVLIGEQGEIAHVEVRTSIPGLDEAAVSCARQWQFEPMRVSGKPRATLIHAPVAFRIFKSPDHGVGAQQGHEAVRTRFSWRWLAT